MFFWVVFLCSLWMWYLGNCFGAMEVNWCSEFAGDEGRQGGQLKREPGKRASVTVFLRHVSSQSTAQTLLLISQLNCWILATFWPDIWGPELISKLGWISICKRCCQRRKSQLSDADRPPELHVGLDASTVEPKPYADITDIPTWIFPP